MKRHGTWCGTALPGWSLRVKLGLTFERFTDRAASVLVLAQEEATLLNHAFIGTEHILLGLISEGDGLAFQALARLDVPRAAVREMVEKTVGPGLTTPTGSAPFTPRAKRALELAFREALRLGHKSIGTEHILLGMVREGEGVGVFDYLNRHFARTALYGLILERDRRSPNSAASGATTTTPSRDSFRGASAGYLSSVTSAGRTRPYGYCESPNSSTS